MPEFRNGGRGERSPGVVRRRRYRPAVARTERAIFAKQLRVLFAQFFVEALCLMGTLKHAPKSAAVAVEDRACPHKRRDGLAVLRGVHEPKGRDEDAFVSFRTGG